MTKINLLDASVYNLISAGEVVERPSSVVKELVENSIDAGAGEITVSIFNGGLENITIIDNGCGMNSENLKLCFLPHATSKLAKATDLESISTLGFRGEALASISAVSRITASSRENSEEIGHFVKINGGKVEEVGEIGMSCGTKISVDNLFYNTPVRAKFLKKDKQEEAYVTSTITQLILANPTIRFKYICNDKTIFMTTGSLEEAIYTIYKNEIANELIPFSYDFDNYKIFGYTGKRDFSKHNRNFQTIIINGRTISNFQIQTAVAQAYGTSLMKRCYPVFVLNIVMPFDQVDVNVHPNKNEVRFVDNNKIFSYIYRAISLALSQEDSYLQLNKTSEISEDSYVKSPNIELNNLTNEKNLEKANDFSNINIDSGIDGGIEKDEIRKLIKQQEDLIAEKSYNSSQIKISPSVKDSSSIRKAGLTELPSKSSLSFNYLDDKAINNVNNADNSSNIMRSHVIKNLSENSYNSQLFDEISFALQDDYRVVGQVFDTYLIVEYNEKVYILDQHACHERILYDIIVEQINKKEVVSQAMLLPYYIDCNNSQYEFLNSIIDELRAIGFVINEVSSLSFEVTAVPFIIADINLKIFFDNLIFEQKTLTETKNSDLIKDKLAQRACKAAIKGGDKLNETQIRSLLTSMKNGVPLQCPHGRPAVKIFERRDFDKLFKRIV